MYYCRLLAIMHICFNWGGCFSDGKDVIKVAFGNEEMIIILSASTDREPPAFVTRISAGISQWPYRKAHQPSYSVVKSNYRDAHLVSVLQKVEVVNESAPDKINDCKVKVSEFEIEADYYYQVPPDDIRKCTRTFEFTLVGEKLHLDYGEKDKEMKSSVFERKSNRTDLDNLFASLTDRTVDEAKALAVFQAFHREAWLINDSILVGALVDAEKENEKKALMKLVQVGKIRDLSHQSIKSAVKHGEEEYLEYDVAMMTRDEVDNDMAMVTRMEDNEARMIRKEVDNDVAIVIIREESDNEMSIMTREEVDEGVKKPIEGDVEMDKMSDEECVFITEDELWERSIPLDEELVTEDEQWERKTYD